MTATRLFDRAVVRVSPLSDEEDAVAFLQGLLTNDVTGSLPAYAALLSAQGKTMFDLIVWQDGKHLLLDCEAAHAEELVKRLSLYRLRRKIEIRLDETLGVFWSLEGPTAIELRQIADMGPWGRNVAPDPRLAALGNRWVGAALPADESAENAWRAHRLALGVPEGRDELGDVLWLETNAVELHGVSFSKGCYVGQENTARMNWRQKVNRRLVVVPLDRSEEKRRKAAYPALGLAVDHLRLDAIDPAWAPAWLAGSLSLAE